MQTTDNGGNSYGTSSKGVSSQLSNQDSAINFLGDHTQHEENTCNNTPAVTAIGSSWQISLNNEDHTQKNDNSGCPDTYENMMTRMTEIEKTLTAIKETVKTSSVKCYLLNIDVITMFRPEMVDELSNAVEQCEKCIKAMETLSYEDTSKEPSG